MPRKTMIEAIRDAMDVMMGRDDNVVVFGEDVGYFGGVFRATQGLQAKYGKSRCFDTPISELGIVGAAVGMAAYGLRPCVEIQFADYMYPGLRPDRLGGRAPALSLERPVYLPARRAECRPAAESSADRPIARARRRCSRMSAASRRWCHRTRAMPRGC